MLTYTQFKPLLIGAIGAVLGGSILLASLHIWNDHQTFHALLNSIIAQSQQNQQTQQAQQPKK